MQLLMHVAPFAQTDEGKEMLVTKLGELAVGLLGFDRVFEELPNLQIAQEIGSKAPWIAIRAGFVRSPIR